MDGGQARSSQGVTGGLVTTPFNFDHWEWPSQRGEKLLPW